MTMSLVLAGLMQWLVLSRLTGGKGSCIAIVGAVAAIAIVIFGRGVINREVGWVVLGVLQWLVLPMQLGGAG